LFFKTLFCGYFLIALQWFFAYRSGWLNQKQMLKCGNWGYSLLQHGGMWTDVFVITPAIAYIMSKYKLAYLSWWGVLLFVAISAFVIWAMLGYQQSGKIIPEAYSHYGKTGIAGYLHGLYAILGIWVITMFLITPIYPHASVQDLIIVAVAVTILFPLGVWKFNTDWQWAHTDTVQVTTEIIIYWAITFMRIAFKW